VHVLDVLTSPPETSIEAIMIPPVELRPATGVMQALRILQERHRRMAFVVDEGGRCQGIVTVKDLVEEIVGELGAW